MQYTVQESARRSLSEKGAHADPQEMFEPLHLRFFVIVGMFYISWHLKFIWFSFSMCFVEEKNFEQNLRWTFRMDDDANFVQTLWFVHTFCIPYIFAARNYECIPLRHMEIKKVFAGSYPLSFSWTKSTISQEKKIKRKTIYRLNRILNTLWQVSVQCFLYCQFPCQIHFSFSLFCCVKMHLSEQALPRTTTIVIRNGRFQKYPKMGSSARGSCFQ